VGYTQDVHRNACISLCEMTYFGLIKKKIKLDIPYN